MWNNSHFQLPLQSCAVCHKTYLPPQGSTRSKYCCKRCRTFRNNSLKSTIVDTKKIQCAICWRYFVKPWAHVVQYHWMTARKYREAYGFDVKRWQVTEEHRELLADNVFSNGTVENLKAWAPYRFKKWWDWWKYKRSEQTIERILNQPQIFKKKTQSLNILYMEALFSIVIIVFLVVILWRPFVDIMVMLISIPVLLITFIVGIVVSIFTPKK